MNGYTIHHELRCADLPGANTFIGTGNGYLWSNASNWSGGVPANGSSAAVAGTGYDDLSSLSLASLTPLVDTITNVTDGAGRLSGTSSSSTRPSEVKSPS